MLARFFCSVLGGLFVVSGLIASVIPTDPKNVH